MRKALVFGVLAILLAAASPARAQLSLPYPALTIFFRTADLEPLSQSHFVLNLAAQSSAKIPQDNVNLFDDFYLINGQWSGSPNSLIVHFNGVLQNLGQRQTPPWIGVAQFSNHAITYDIQAGFQQVKAKYGMPNARAAGVVVYRTLNTGLLVYDYRIPVKGGRCQEYLFTPDSGGFQLGMQGGCYISLAAAGRSRAGHR
ncbi:hypothetical protein KQX64_18695 [Rhodopseudomonas palustris]|nr:hypothetical protein KQX64_18695 [Rhodopseudomonas palustris]